jgi:hypothetical protein
VLTDGVSLTGPVQHTISSTSTLFGKEGRMRSSQKQPFISSAHARANLGVDGPGPARVSLPTKTVAAGDALTVAVRRCFAV